jgi:hypothetical protein
MGVPPVSFQVPKPVRNNCRGKSIKFKMDSCSKLPLSEQSSARRILEF